jgi:3-hydroxymyristoyl/3-hydroxydecanoyl-(acyl carrier protein) dehydratase
VELLQFRGKVARMKGIASVDGQVTTEAEMMACVVDK